LAIVFLSPQILSSDKGLLMEQMVELYSYFENIFDQEKNSNKKPCYYYYTLDEEGGKMTS
jgi:hypothetical protein